MEKFCNLAFLEQQLEEHNRNEQDKVEVCLHSLDSKCTNYIYCICNCVCMYLNQSKSYSTYKSTGFISATKF